MNTELQEEAWKMLDGANLSLNEKIKVQSTFANTFIDEYPFIKIRYKNGKVEYYHSEIDAISHLMFTTEKEVILANAIYENTKDKFNINEFTQQLKFVIRILQIDSTWK